MKINLDKDNLRKIFHSKIYKKKGFVFTYKPLNQRGQILVFEFNSSVSRASFICLVIRNRHAFAITFYG